MKACRKWHGDFTAGCPICERVRTDPAYADKWGESKFCTRPFTGPADALPPLTTERIDRPGAGFNASHLPGLLAWRTAWAGAEIHVNDRTLTDLRHPRAGWGREDPRLFTFRDRPHVSFVGVEGAQGPTSQCYARLRPDLTVEKVFYPHYTGRKAWEKNWQFFEHERELYAVYTISPHVVLHVQGDRAHPFSNTPIRFAWTGGELRGGAPPVRVGDRFYCWFHGARDIAGRRRYNVGLYTFEAKPPFRPLGMTPDPVLWATTPGPTWADVVFPGGATIDGDTWTVSAGVHDRWIEKYTWSHAAVSALLAPPTVRRPLPCLHLDRLVSKASCSCPRKDGYQCGRGHGVVRPGVECEGCADYEEDA